MARTAQAGLTRIQEVVAAAPEDQWPALRPKIAEALTTSIADPGIKQATTEALTALLDRLRKLDPAQAGAKQKQLAGDLSALLPAGVPILGSDFAPAAGAGEAATLGKPGPGARAGAGRPKAKAYALFMLPTMPRLLEEMRGARAKAPTP